MRLVRMVVHGSGGRRRSIFFGVAGGNPVGMWWMRHGIAAVHEGTTPGKAKEESLTSMSPLFPLRWREWKNRVISFLYHMTLRPTRVVEEDGRSTPKGAAVIREGTGPLRKPTPERTKEGSTPGGERKTMVPNGAAEERSSGSRGWKTGMHFGIHPRERKGTMQRWILLSPTKNRHSPFLTITTTAKNTTVIPVYDITTIIRRTRIPRCLVVFEEENER